MESLGQQYDLNAIDDLSKLGMKKYILSETIG